MTRRGSTAIIAVTTLAAVMSMHDLTGCYNTRIEGPGRDYKNIRHKRDRRGKRGRR